MTGPAREYLPRLLAVAVLIAAAWLAMACLPPLIPPPLDEFPALAAFGAVLAVLTVAAWIEDRLRRHG
jgi:hypothetical protein